MSDTEFEENVEINNEELEEEEYDINEMSSHEEFLLINDPTKYTYMRRVVQRPNAKKNEIYLTNNGNYLYYLKRAKNLLNVQKEKEIIIHGLGAAIPKAVKLSLYLNKEIPNSILSTTTSTEEIIDQYDPLTNDLEPILKIRHASAIHIKIINNDLFPTNNNNNNSNTSLPTTLSTLTPIKFKTNQQYTAAKKSAAKQKKDQELDQKVEQLKKQQQQHKQEKQQKKDNQQQLQQQRNQQQSNEVLSTTTTTPKEKEEIRNIIDYEGDM